MSDREPHTRHSDDAQHDDAPPTDAMSDEVKTDAVSDQAAAGCRGRHRADASLIRGSVSAEHRAQQPIDVGRSQRRRG